ncbi:MAG: MarR family transcriptional regulator [Acidobacteriota bacterium]|nr:MarR family transcriptional regulator [Acidobacteriota bacterium]MDH3522647.1 MarR family transcriptional regulator [Acidobacteriota bacterium]
MAAKKRNGIAAATNGRKGGNRTGADGLVRYAHIFASAVKESLEVDLLRETGGSLTPPQFHLLRLIALNGRHQIGEVADFLGVTPPAATKAIDKLEGLGLVRREPSTKDRRATLLAVTKPALALVARYEELERTRLGAVLAAFSAEEISQFSGLLERFALRLVAQSEDDGGLCLRCSAYFDDRCPVHDLTANCPYQRMVSGKGRDRAAVEA